MASNGRQRVYGRILRGLDALAAAGLHARMGVERQEVLLSAGGDGVGSLWTAVPTESDQRLTNAQWTVAMRTRLGLQSDLGPEPT